MKTCSTCKHFIEVYTYKELVVGRAYSLANRCGKTIEKISPITGSILYAEAMKARDNLPKEYYMLDKSEKEAFYKEYCGPDARLHEK